MKYPFVLSLLLFSFLTGHAQKEKDQPTSFEDDLSIGWKKAGDTLQLVAKSKILAPIEIIFNSRKNDNELQSFILPPKDSLTVYAKVVQGADSVARKEFSEKIRLSYFWGHKDLIQADSTYLYRFPFQKKTKYRLSQGWGGKVSHKTEKSYYALDFQLDVGEPVHAAREGLVVKVIDWFTKQGGRELINAANRVVILHDDGTYGSYVHLVYKSIVVEEGQRIQKGQLLGRAGVTGFSTGPHLHFVVRKERDIAVPVYFEGHEGKVLKPGKKYSIK